MLAARLTTIVGAPSTPGGITSPPHDVQTGLVRRAASCHPHGPWPRTSWRTRSRELIPGSPLVSLTTIGREELAAALELWRQLDEETTAALSATEQAELLRLLRRVRASLKDC